ncbi:MAG: hypothetical protein WD767_06245 [Alphaproteobacteria bacterium]
MKAICRDPELWRRRYEVLREQATGGGADVLAPPPLGMYLMRHYGVGGWMRRWAESAEDCAAGAASARSTSRAPLPVELAPASLWREELTVLLAQMTFQHLRTG